MSFILASGHSIEAVEGGSIRFVKSKIYTYICCAVWNLTIQNPGSDTYFKAEIPYGCRFGRCFGVINCFAHNAEYNAKCVVGISDGYIQIVDPSLGRGLYESEVSPCTIQFSFIYPTDGNRNDEVIQSEYQI